MSDYNALVGAAMAPPILEPREGRRYETPAGSFELPIRYTGCRNVTLALPASLQALRALVPQGVRPRRVFGDNGMLVFQFVDFPTTSIGPYRECSISIACHDDWSWPELNEEWLFRPNPAFALWLSVSSELARISGQAVWGYPKTIAETELSWRDGEFRGRVRLDGGAGIECWAGRPEASAEGAIELRVLTMLAGRLRRSFVRGRCAQADLETATLTMTPGAPITDALLAAVTSETAFWAVQLDDFAFELPAPLEAP